MPLQRLILLSLAAALACSAALAAPDEDLLGKAAGYPAAPRLGQAFQEAYRVGSFSAMDTLSPHCVLGPRPSRSHCPKPPANPPSATDLTERL